MSGQSAGPTSGAARRIATVGRTAQKEHVDLSVNRVRPGYQQVADQLLELILAGTLAAGDQLPSELKLSETFGVSRSTVREGLRYLASRELIYTTRGASGGTFVSRVNIEQYSDFLETSIGLLSGDHQVSVENMLEARELIEVPAARLAASERQPVHIEAMREAIKFESDTRNRGLKFKGRWSFHGLILVASRNELLGEMSEPVFRVLQAQFVRTGLLQEFWDQVNSDHEEILACIENGEADGAARAMQQHVERLQNAYHKESD